MAVALLAMLSGGVGAGTATVLAQQTGDAGQARDAQAAGRTTSSPPPTTTSKPKPSKSAEPKPSTKRTPKPSKRPTKPTTSSKPAPETSEPQLPKTPASAVQQVVDLVNQARADAGCDPLRVDERLNRAAGKHSADMAARDYFSHDTPEGEDFAERIEDEGYPNPGAENIARGQRNAGAVMDSWMSSGGHRANIVNCELTAIGIGLAKEDWVWTQDFGY